MLGGENNFLEQQSALTEATFLKSDAGTCDRKQLENSGLKFIERYWKACKEWALQPAINLGIIMEVQIHFF